jgi:glutamine synthetase
MAESKLKWEDAVFDVIKQYIKDSKPIRFEGNSYSEEWKIEAAKRGLSNHANTPDAIKTYISPEAVALYGRNKVFTERELIARYEIKLEKYVYKMQIESRLIGDLAVNHIIPTAIKYQNTLIANARGLKEVLDSKTYVKLSRNQIQSIKEISEHISQIKTYVEEMINERKIANRIESPEEKAHAYCYNVKPYFEKTRYHVDKLELLVDDQLWPLPKYRELLFIK